MAKFTPESNAQGMCACGESSQYNSEREQDRKFAFKDISSEKQALKDIIKKLSEATKAKRTPAIVNY